MRAPFHAKDLRAETIYREPFVAVLPASHEWAERSAVTAGDLADSDFVLFPRAASSGLYDTILRLCVRAGFSPVVVQEANAKASVVALVESGLGITIAPASASRACPANVSCVPLAGTEDHAELAMIRTAGAISPLISRFQDIVTSALAGDQGQGTA